MVGLFEPVIGRGLAYPPLVAVDYPASKAYRRCADYEEDLL
jgi:hypothetical protein